MADSNVVFEIGQSIVEMMKKLMTPEPIASEEYIGLCAPHEPGDFQLTVWVYSFEEANETGSSAGYIRNPANPKVEIHAPMRIKLNALLTAHSKAPIQSKFPDMYRVIGRAMQVIKDNPFLDEKYLIGSLRDAGLSPNIMLLKPTTDEMTKIWNNANKPMNPSFAISVSSVEMDSTRTRKIPGRVVEAEISVIKKENKK